MNDSTNQGNHNDERIAALKARAEGMGLRVRMPEEQLWEIYNPGADWFFYFNEAMPHDIAAAHALLTGLSMVRGPTLDEHINARIDHKNLLYPAPPGKEWRFMLVDVPAIRKNGTTEEDNNER